MVRITSDRTYSIEQIASKIAVTNGVKVEEDIPIKEDNIKHQHQTNGTDNEIEYSKRKISTTIQTIDDNDYELASKLSDEYKKEFCSDMCVLFHGEFQLTFGRYFSPDQWILIPLGTDGGTCKLSANTLWSITS